MERYSIIWYWVLDIGYWCLSEIDVNFIYLRKVKYKNQKKFLYASTGYLVPNTSSIEFDSIEVIKFPTFAHFYESI